MKRKTIRARARRHRSTATMRIRIQAEEKKRLAEVAELVGMSLSVFLLTAAVAKAYRVLGPPRLVRARGQ